MSSVEPAPRRRLGYQPALDGLRGVAVLAVVADHGLAINSGFIGVNVFFVLSGFLITTLLLEEWVEHHRIDLRRFYRRRVWRLYPALAVTVAAYLAITLGLATAHAGQSSLASAATGAMVSASYVANVYASAHELPEGLRHLWSLATEEQFYVIWPMLLLVALRRQISTSALMRSLAALTALILLYRAVLTIHGASMPRLRQAPDTTADGLLLGCLIAFALHNGLLPRLARSSAVRRCAGGCALATLLVIAFNGADDTSRVYYLGLLGVVDLAAGFVLLTCVLDPYGWTARVLSLRWLSGCGRISYSLYLVHPLILWQLVVRHHVLSPLAAIALSFVAALALYYFVELPLRARGRAVRRERGSEQIHREVDRRPALEEAPRVALEPKL
jgi:peptidoglycan/LPS O-acetylase OafA/YrhL